ncbi:hypothetical protein [Candidatus Pantoea bituminis]|uniref:hypothetical protein n=1 Tax=Candidatus Pantoea bituminis TaxID=2831036 RepID=UPI001C060706|nr:hypothetical protein [Pantoea bituminis]
MPFEMARIMASHGNINVVIFYNCLHYFDFFKYGCRIKTLVLFPVLMIGFALARPVNVMDQPQWPLIFNTESGGKYFHVTNIALACLAISLISVLPKYKNFTL